MTSIFRYASKLFDKPVTKLEFLYTLYEGFEWTTPFPEYGFILGGIPDTKFFKQHPEIAGIINMCDEHPDSFPINTLWLPTIDTLEPTTLDMELAVQFIDKILLDNPKNLIYIHCRAGISRSATICIAWLCYKYHKTREESFDIIKAKRPQISNTCYYRNNIIEFHDKLLSDDKKSSKIFSNVW